MTTKTKLIIAVVALLAAYAFGRFSAPTKVITETKIVEVEKKTDKTKSDTKKEVHRTTTTTETIKPDGTKTVTTVVKEDSNSDSKKNSSSTDNTTKSSDTIKEVIRDTSKVTVSALAGVNITSLSIPVYGASLTKPILGPIAIGIWGLTNSVGGVSLGLTF